MQLYFSAFGDSISKQLKKQKINFDKETVSHFEKDSNSIMRLKVRGIINGSTGKKAQDKLFKEIEKHLKKLNPCSTLPTTPNR